MVCKGKPRCVTYKLRFPSVGATQNLICASVLSKGKTVLKNCAIEPEIVALERLLINMGAKISGVGCSTVTITGVSSLHTATANVIPDRVVTATYLASVVCAGGKVTLTNCNPRHLRSFLQLVSANFPTKVYKHEIQVDVTTKASSYGVVQTAPYPYFPTDMQSLLLSMSCYASGQTTIVENLFENRLLHNATELNKMGGNVVVDGRVATINGSTLVGRDVFARDLRGGAGLVVAGLGAQGQTHVHDVEHIHRGYANLAQNLNCVGAKIHTVN